jgi:2-keto-4-pentenoate hydratase/2-oxohepta-3-ene-1,7-dioic acid hydratase in catechol pathway
MKQRWVRYSHAASATAGEVEFGTLHDDHVHQHVGDMFGSSKPTGAVFALTEVKLLMPVQPSKVVALWNNFKALGDKLNLVAPPEPLYFLKSPNSYLAPGENIRNPSAEANAGKIVFEGELGIVIGKTCSAVSEAQALDHVFGYTCANDVTAAELLNRDSTFAQWTRAKGFDTFCPLGPAVATGLDASTLTVKTRLNGAERQNYPVSDMRFSVAQLVSKISFDMTLNPGDVILCGTSIGVGSMKPDSHVEIEIDGIGTLSNRFG